MKLICDKIEKSVESLGKQPFGLLSGITKLDETLRGFLPARLYTIGGPPSLGKTSIILDIALNVALTTRVLFLSLEMNFDRLQLRGLCNIAGINHHRVCLGNLSPKEKSTLDDAVKDIKNRKILVDDETSAVCPGDFKEKYKRAIPDKSMNKVIENAVNVGCKLIIIDYLQLVRLSAKNEVEYLRLHEITWELHNLAKKFNIAIILASQFSRPDSSRYGKDGIPRPRLSDLRGSGSIEQDSDVVILLHRPQYYNKTEEIDLFADTVEDDAELIVAKNRDGPTGVINVSFLPSVMSWKSIEENFGGV